ncbi:hypothetical protein C9I98_20285 [Photobacterium sanctipauli]|uniref:PD(D/E)XK endonuclease domain-containing protein n=1 Tax=Photobacterium sanctipauli TaxID=1342794 RepID=A0A2T3NMZ8_9GAMM|nr:hypothetical protein [Photobacterium sanctipauli]PSW16887.1 hypothetical protein C9I98_20285 [Photobacterium sanctipauli]
MNHLKVLNSVITLLDEIGAVSKGSMGKLMGDKAELVICLMTNGKLSASNQPGYDLIGTSLLPDLEQDKELRYEVKLRRSSVTACNFENSKLGKFDVGIVIWYDETTLQPSAAFAIPHSVIEDLARGKRAHITKKICREHGFDFLNQLYSFW